MSLDLRLLVVSDETPESDGSESMAVGLIVPLGRDGATGLASTAAYVALPPDGPGCRLPTAACSPVTDEFASRGADPAPGAGRLLAGSIDSLEHASSLALRLPASCWETVAPLRVVVLRLPVGTAGFFLRPPKQFCDCNLYLPCFERYGALSVTITGGDSKFGINPTL